MPAHAPRTPHAPKPLPPAEARHRDPQATRQALLLAAFEEIHEQGFRAASLDRILERAGVTKGALYHHFENKTALGHAVLDEVILPEAAQWGARFEDPAVDVIAEMTRFIREETDHVLARGLAKGCPINNLVQEMSPVDEGFRVRLVRLQDEWRAALERALRRAQKERALRGDIDPKQFAAVLVASYEGAQSLGKCTQDPKVYRLCMDGIVAMVDALRVR
jgi:AcrR family transcriptional regulator